MKWNLGILIGAGIISIANCVHNIRDYGAIVDLKDTPTAFANALAFQKAVHAANASDIDREILIPSGDIYHMMPSYFENIKDMTFTIEAILYFSEDSENWPLESDGNRVQDFFHVQDSQRIHIRGNGTIEGQGYWWWNREYLMLNKHNRPNMIRLIRVQDALIEGVSFRNSPRFHLEFDDVDNITCLDFIIEVDVFEQKALAKQYGYFNF